MKQVKTKIIKAGGILLFLLLVFLIGNRIISILMYKDMGGGGGWQRFYAAEKNSIDVMFYGSSHCHCTVDHGKLWNDYGMAGYSLTAGYQHLDATWYFMKESLRTQRPKAMVVELLMAGQDDETDQAGVYRNALGMRYGRSLFGYINRLKENTKITQELRQQVLFKLPVIHSRYKELTREDFEQELPFLRGYRGSYEQVPYEAPAAARSDAVAELSDTNRKYLYKMIELSREEEIPLLFFVAPYIVEEEQQALFNAAEQLAREEGIPCVNFNKIYQEIGFNYATDMREASHVNNYGAQKVTEYLARLLKKTCEIPDRRGDPDYFLWEQNSRYLNNLEYKASLERQAEIGDYFQALKDREDYVTIVALSGNYKALGDVYADSLLPYGIDREGYEKGGVWVKQKGRFVFYSEGKDVWKWESKPGRGEICLRGWAEHLPSGEIQQTTELLIEGTEHKTVENGVNVIIYDSALNEIVDRVGINVYEGLAVVRTVKEQESGGS